MSTGLAGPTPPTSPRQRSKLPKVFDGRSLSTPTSLTRLTNAEDSPFRPARDLRPNYQGFEEVNAVRTLRQLPSQTYMPLDALQEMLRGNYNPVVMRRLNANLVDHHIALNRDQPGVDSRSNLASDRVNSCAPHPLPGLFSAQRIEPDANAPGVDELSSGLGLPGIKKSTTNADSPAPSHKSRSSEGLSEGIFGKLIGRALDKPLTADALAQYLNSKTVTSDDIANITQDSKGYILDRSLVERAVEERQPTRVVPPPPGFFGERPRRILAEERNSVNPVVIESPVQQVPAGPAAFGHPRRFSNLQSAYIPQYHGHTRQPPSMMQPRPRALTRTKRTDQGPEPSHADIYPDDASFVPRHPSYPQVPAQVFQGFMPAMPSENRIHVGVAVWPTPAEVYTSKPASPTRRSVFARNVQSTENSAPEPWPPQAPASMSQYMQQFREPSHPFAFTFPPPVPSPSPPFDIFANHHVPTYADIHDTDKEMECLLAILPNIFDLDLPELPCDNRPLTPGQTYGTRYGLGLHGIGVGGTWKCPDAREGESFRVRPRDHDGWGGWQWAIDKGWGDE